MAYKFQIGRTRLSGSTLFENGLDVSGSVGVETALVVPAIGVSTDKDIISLAAQTVTLASDVDINVQKAGGLQLGGSPVTSTAAELNLLDDAAAGTVVNSKAVIYSAGGVVQGTDFKGPDGFDIGNASNADALKFNASEIIVKDGVDLSVATVGGFNYGGSPVTSTAAELNLLDLGLDRLTDGKVVANKAVVVDGNRDLTGSAEGDKIRDMEVFRDFEAGRRVKADRVQAQSGGQLQAYLSGSGEISGSGPLQVGGAGTISGNFLVGGTVQFANIATDTALDVANDGLYFRDANDSDKVKQVDVSSFIEDIAGNGIKESSNQAVLDFDGLAAAAFATDDTFAFNDDDDNVVKKVTIDNLITKAPALLTEEVLATQDDFIIFLDGSGTGDAKKEKLVDLMSSQAGTGVSVVAGQFTVDTSGGDRISSTSISSGGDAVAGINFFAATQAGNGSVTLPASPTVGDVVTIKLADINPGVTVTVNASGSRNIDGQASQILESPFAAISCVYVSGSTGNDWRII